VILPSLVFPAYTIGTTFPGKLGCPIKKKKKHKETLFKRGTLTNATDAIASCAGTRAGVNILNFFLRR
jgi:hypothetical protein